MKQLGFVFPGQGSQKIGMLDDLQASYPIIQSILDKASDYFGYDVAAIIQQGPESTINSTAYTQPLMLAADVAVWHLWCEQQGPQPTVMAGHSLGEYAALVAAQVITLEDALYVVSQRAQLMQQAVPEGEGAMAAIMGLDITTVKQLCDEVNHDQQQVEPANFNSPKQVVVAGQVSGVEQLIERAKQAGAKRAKQLPMSVPSHCFLLEQAANQLADVLHKITFQKPKIPVINNVDAQALDEPEAIKHALQRQLANPVRWVDIIEAMEQDYNVSTIIECGPNKVLTGLNRRIGSAHMLTLTTAKQFQQALQGDMEC